MVSQLACANFAVNQRKAALAVKVAHERQREDIAEARVKGEITEQQFNDWWDFNDKVIHYHNRFIDEIAVYEAFVKAKDTQGAEQQKQKVLEALQLLRDTVADAIATAQRLQREDTP